MDLRHFKPLLQNGEGTTIFCNPSTELLTKTKSSLQASITIISGPQTSQYHLVDRKRGITIGSAISSEVQISDVGISRKHAHLYWSHGKIFLKDLTSANGTYVNGAKINEEIALKDGDQITLGITTTLKFGLNNLLDIEYHHLINDQLTHDSLTRIYNKRTFTEYLFNELSYARRFNTPVCLVMIDIDYFKKINDAFGHLSGDQCLINLASLLQKLSRTEDYVCRFGGEEFCVICRNINDQSGMQFAQRILKAVESFSFDIDGANIQFTVSIGIACHPFDNSKSVVELVEHADRALYQAKSSGRNCSRIYKPATSRYHSAA